MQIITKITVIERCINNVTWTAVAYFKIVLEEYLTEYLFLLYGKLRERVVCGEFCVLIGYPSGQDGAILPERARWSDTARPGLSVSFPQIKISPKFKRVHESFLSPKLFSAKAKRFFCDFSVFMKPGKASTRMKTKKTKMLMSFKNTFSNKIRQTQKFGLNLNIWKFEFEM